MPLVTVLATGGTIASRADVRGGATAQDGGAELVDRLDLPAGHRGPGPRRLPRRAASG